MRTKMKVKQMMMMSGDDDEDQEDDDEEGVGSNDGRSGAEDGNTISNHPSDLEDDIPSARKPSPAADDDYGGTEDATMVTTVRLEGARPKMDCRPPTPPRAVQTDEVQC